MVVVLFTIALVASAAVGGVYALTAETIEAVKLQKQIDAIRRVLPEFDNDPMADKYTQSTADGGELEFYPARKGDALVGIAVKSYTNSGFSGLISVMVGFLPDGAVYNYSVLEHKETPGLGSKMDVWFISGGRGDITGKTPGTSGLQVSKDGGSVDAITAATISSRAFLDAINRAASALAGSADKLSGTTATNE